MNAPDRFIIMLNLGGAVMQSPEDVASALERTAQQLRDSGTFDSGTIRDEWGNSCGAFMWEDSTE